MFHADTSVNPNDFSGDLARQMPAPAASPTDSGHRNARHLTRTCSRDSACGALLRRRPRLEEKASSAPRDMWLISATHCSPLVATRAALSRRHGPTGCTVRSALSTDHSRLELNKSDGNQSPFAIVMRPEIVGALFDACPKPHVRQHRQRCGIAAIRSFVFVSEIL